MIYKIQKIELVNLKSGRVKKSAELIQEGGDIHKGVTIWSSFPNFANLNVGNVVDGDIEITQNGQYTNKTLQPGKNPNGTYKPTPNGSNFANKGIGRPNPVTIEKIRNENIQENMKTKAEGQAYGNSVTNAVLIALEMTKRDPSMNFFPTFIHYRDLLIAESEKYQNPAQPRSPVDIDDAPII